MGDESVTLSVSPVSERLFSVGAADSVEVVTSAVLHERRKNHVAPPRRSSAARRTQGHTRLLRRYFFTERVTLLKGRPSTLICRRRFFFPSNFPFKTKRGSPACRFGRGSTWNTCRRVRWSPFMR